MPNVAQAQLGDEMEMEEIVVRGIRGSLRRSMDLKRHAVGIVDAISAEDIGKFPDTNLAESLQRITGVAIDRVGNEGNQVTVRGVMPAFSLVTLNGRQQPNSSALASRGISRSFNFRHVAPESVRSVEVHKTGKAEFSSGGIGSTINVVTGKPFDYDGLITQASITGVVDTSVNRGDSVTPEISGMISNTFADETFGVLFSYSYAERDYSVSRIGIQSLWRQNSPGIVGTIDTSAIDQTRNPDLNLWRAVTVDDEVADYNRKRQNGHLVLQWAPTDNLAITGDYLRGRFEEGGQQNRMSYWFDNIQRGTADANGTLVDYARDDDELNFWAWEYGFETENDSYGVNIDWQVTDALSLVLDIHDSTSHANPGALPAERLANLKNAFAAPVTIRADFSGKIPRVSYDDSALGGDAPDGLKAYDPANIEADLYQERGNEVENNIQQINLRGRWENTGEGGLAAINFGLTMTDYNFDVTEIYSASFALGTPAQEKDEDGNLLPAKPPAMDISGLDISYISSGGIGFPHIARYDALQFIDIVEAQGLKRPTSLGVSTVNEETLALYGSFDFDTEFNGMPFRANMGVRYEETDVTAESLATPVVGFSWITPLRLSEIRHAEQVADQLEGNYEHFLPNVDLSLEILDGLISRFSYSETVTRSNISAMFPSTNINVARLDGSFRAAQGNPGLLPYQSKNIDLSVEWYYNEDSYASIGYFNKNIRNFIATDVEDRVIVGPNGPLTNPGADANKREGCPGGTEAAPLPACVSQPGDEVILWEVTTSVNRGDSKIWGWEFSLQHLFGDSGFGGIFNYTMADIDNADGLSDTANVVGFWEKGDWAIRVAYNWRDRFLLSRTNGEPKFTEEYSQFDFSGSYTFSDQYSVFIEAINITDEPTHRTGRWENQLYDYEEYGARYTVGVRGRW